MAKRGAPRKTDRAVLAAAFEKYIEETDIPIIAEFATNQKVVREHLYDMPELSTLLKRCTQKKEANLEKRALNGDVNTSMAIFSLKQLGWSDKMVHAGDPKAPLALMLNGSDVDG